MAVFVHFKAYLSRNFINLSNSPTLTHQFTTYCPLWSLSNHFYWFRLKIFGVILFIWRGQLHLDRVLITFSSRMVSSQLCVFFHSFGWLFHRLPLLTHNLFPFLLISLCSVGRCCQQSCEPRNKHSLFTPPQVSCPNSYPIHFFHFCFHRGVNLSLLSQKQIPSQIQFGKSSCVSHSVIAVKRSEESIVLK